MKLKVGLAVSLAIVLVVAVGIVVFPGQARQAVRVLENAADTALVGVAGYALDNPETGETEKESLGAANEGPTATSESSDGLSDEPDAQKDGTSQEGLSDASGRSGSRDSSLSQSNAQPGDDPEIPAVPQCTVTDDDAPYGDLDSWQFTLLDHQYALASDYAPTDLVEVSSLGVAGNGQVREVMAADLVALSKAAKKAGAAIEIHSAYRSYDKQVQTYSSWESASGSAHAKVSSARAGHSEHQLGTAVDIRSAGTVSPWESGYWGDTKAGKWMTKNGWKYGFVMSYPDGKSEQTCYMHEAWHYRYVGLDMALVVEESGLTLREFLWDNAQATSALD